MSFETHQNARYTRTVDYDYIVPQVGNFLLKSESGSIPPQHHFRHRRVTFMGVLQILITSLKRSISAYQSGDIKPTQY